MAEAGSGGGDSTGALDPVEVAGRLIRCPSVTPAEGGAIDLLEQLLAPLGFACHRLRFEAPGTDPIENLYARIGTGGPHFCFAGHTDVVPVGDAAAWTVGPFEGEVRDGLLWGRGAADMKGGIAAFVAAASRVIAENDGTVPGSISLLITGDEEGPAVNGTTRVLDWMEANGEIPDACVVGEPTNPQVLGDMMKIGRRGSLTGRLTVHGTQGHVAYPHLAENPIHHLLRMLEPFAHGQLDEGTAHFPPSTLMVTTIDVGNPATNVVPARATAVFNIRFNDAHTSESLERMLRASFDQKGARYELTTECSGESFVTEPGALSSLVADAAEQVTGRRPELSTTGGTSDARFIKRLCPVVEFGLVGQTMHKVDERVPVADVRALTDIYAAMLRRFFA
ncbi:succinyl-diaminopimelate desuccinylase [Thalassobaculum fulvum]|uniref:Succinyl-diaminopimelate desuccinylase n=1 Tax=Thalassobaculum fulvum TaxID=1633335 RepID=A0A918XUB1_9PROT|nr:succinyl-diaminopimelate desuccinylase [Thalassobaculum fulvum]GHD56681.1 succinyl-diaminopimelate desuccinylase [Thalassobaculum fulvum]